MPSAQSITNSDVLFARVRIADGALLAHRRLSGGIWVGAPQFARGAGATYALVRKHTDRGIPFVLARLEADASWSWSREIDTAGFLSKVVADDHVIAIIAEAASPVTVEGRTYNPVQPHARNLFVVFFDHQGALTNIGHVTGRHDGWEHALLDGQLYYVLSGAPPRVGTRSASGRIDERDLRCEMFECNAYSMKAFDGGALIAMKSWEPGIGHRYEILLVSSDGHLLEKQIVPLPPSSSFRLFERETNDGMLLVHQSKGQSIVWRTEVTLR